MNNMTQPFSDNSSLTTAPNEREQADFVRMLREHNEIPNTLYAKVTGDRSVEVLVPFKGNRCAHYGFGKNRNDDFILFRNGAVSDLESAGNADGVSLFTAAKRFDILQPWSNKEYAICVSPADSGFKHQWLPEHSQVGTVFAVSQRLFVDDAEVTDWPQEETFRQVQSLRIEQRMLGIHPDDDSAPLAEIDCSHVVDRNGVFVHSKIKWLRPVSIAAGYGMMFPAVGAFADKLATGLGHLYEATATDRSRTNLIDDDRALSYAFLHTPEGPDGEHDTMAAMTMHDIAATLRYGQAGRRREHSIVWLEHRNASIQKLYPQIYDHHTVQPGEIYEASGTYFIGERPVALRQWGMQN